MKVTRLELILTHFPRKNASPHLELILLEKQFKIIHSHLSYLSKLKPHKKPSKPSEV